MDLKIKRLSDRLDVLDPSYASAGASGLDLRAAIDAPVQLGGGESVKIPCGFAVEIPEGYEGQVRGRSGLASSPWKIGLTNGIGTIDSDYRGELAVLLTSHADASVSAKWIMPGERIAQLVIVPVVQVVPVMVDELSPSARGENGFGSTGTQEVIPASPAEATGQAATDLVAQNAARLAQEEADAQALREAEQREDAARVAREQEAAAAEEAARTAAAAEEQKRQDELAANATITLYDTVNKVIFLGHPAKETETVVAVEEDSIAGLIIDGATDHRPPAEPAV